GPRQPRSDREDERVRHARLMLILFKPWRTGLELKNLDVGWLEAYENFIRTVNANVSDIINNMRILHECRDKRDD
ncbi:hypothetical protein FKP32DRAFT_1532159, partial [Trametes sanguinea]